MLQELLDRIAEGGIEIHVVPAPSTEAMGNGGVVLKLMDQLMDDEKVYRRLYRLMDKRGYTAQAEALKNFWHNASEPSTALMDELMEIPPDKVGSEEMEGKLGELAEQLKPIVEHLHTTLNGICERQILAICEVDISDLLV